MDAVPNKTLALFLLAGGEVIGIGGYGLTDILTAISGLRDIAEGRKLGTSHDKALLRGALKILGALTPIFPTFWVDQALRVAIPIPELDHKPKK